MTVAAPLDDRTTAAIRDAITAASRGRLVEACTIGERALADGGDSAALNAMLGMLRRQSGDVDESIAHWQIANAARPDDSKIAVNLATALAETGRHGEALEVITEKLALADKSMGLARLRGFLAQSAEAHAVAVSTYERVVAAFPDDWEAWNNLGNARRCTGDFEGSILALKEAARLEPGSLPVQLNLAVAIGAAGDLSEAERQLRALADASPSETQPLQELHALLKEQRREDEALRAIEEAVRRDPANVRLLLAQASYLSQLHQHREAEAVYRRAIALEPTNGLANLGLAIVFELTNREEELSRLVGDAAARGVEDEILSFIKAFDFRRKKRFEDGLRELENVSDALETARRTHLLGQLLDGVGRCDEAFAAFERMNQINREDFSHPEQRGANYRATIGRQLEMLTPTWVSGWREGRVTDGRPSPVFLVGFPRSGTTLLDTMLMGHPRIEVLEEEPALAEANKQFPDFASLADASDELIQAARDTYFRTAGALTPLKTGNLLVDKNPLVMNGLPYIRRLFPDAKIILALRHPCDVVLSCFITNFRANDGMASFLRLDTAAELYDLSFRYFERAQQLLDLPVHEVIYERVVADQETELKALFGFLGLDWHDAVLAHQETARGRGRIKTASYAQVVEPIYTRAAGRWQNYRKHLEPILPTLRPWVEKFGYSLDAPQPGGQP